MPFLYFRKNNEDQYNALVLVFAIVTRLEKLHSHLMRFFL